MDICILKSCSVVLAGSLLLGIAGCAGAQRAAEADRTAYAFWPSYPDEPRLQFVASYRYSSDVRPRRSGFDEMIFGKDQQVLPINMPYGVAMWNGRIYVCDIRNAALLSLDLREQRVRVLGTSGATRFASPTAVAITPDGVKYVTDHRRGAIFVFDAQDRHIETFSKPTFKPSGIAIHNNELFVGDFESSQVIVLDRFTGRELRRIGERGDEDGQLSWPLGVASDRHGNVYVADGLRCRMQKFTRAGQFVSAWGEPGNTIGNFVRPKLLDVDSEGHIYVVDAAFQNVQMFDDEHRLLMFFGGGGEHPGSMLLPIGVSVHEADLDLFKDRIHPSFDAKRLVIVTNQFGPHRISVYAMGQLREGRSARDIAGSIIAIPTGRDQDPDILRNDPYDREFEETPFAPPAPPATPATPATANVVDVPELPAHAPYLKPPPPPAESP